MPYKDKAKKAAYDKVYNAANRDRKLAYSKEYFSVPENAELRDIRSAAWAKSNPKKRRLVVVKFRYGIPEEEYERMELEQGGVCAISGMPPGRPHLSVDHDHITGKNRALLHEGINAALGLFKDNPEWLRRAADYIEYWRGVHEDVGTSADARQASPR